MEYTHTYCKVLFGQCSALNNLSIQTSWQIGLHVTYQAAHLVMVIQPYYLSDWTNYHFQYSLKESWAFRAVFLSPKQSCVAGRTRSALMPALRQLMAHSTIFEKGE